MMAPKIRTLMLVMTLILGGSTSACLKDDVGTCCKVLDETQQDLIPVAPAPDPNDPNMDPASVIRQDPLYDCSGLTCTAYEGSKAFCTRQCQDDTECPEGFTCAPVLKSDPGPGSQIQKDDKFCVRSSHDCDTYDP
jgi:hypothetical protein